MRTIRLLAYHGEGLVGIATAKKLGSHPIRNKLKRRCREAMRACQNLLLPERDYVMVVGLEASKATQIELVGDVKQAVEAINARELPPLIAAVREPDGA